MRVAVVHYHFRPGGVTRVVDSFARNLRESRPAWALARAGGRTEENTGPVPLFVYPPLDYTTDRTTLPTVEEAASALRKGLSNFLGGTPDVWVFENPALGKNPLVVPLANHLAAQGEAVLCHHHDFAEDLRPSNFRVREDGRRSDEPVYLWGARVGHAVINPRDEGILARAGLPGHRVRNLGNPVEGPTAPAGEPGGLNGRPLTLYPVRASRRKNLGEFLLHALGSRQRGEDRLFATTLPPTNTAFEKTFRHWENLAGELRLPVRLAAARTKQARFDEWMERADTILTTSVAEGFGLSFLEPWLFGRPVQGRNLPEVTSTFRELGIHLGGLYERFPVPVRSFDPSRWVEKMACGYRRLLEAFHLQQARDAPEFSEDAELKSGRMDFARLDEDLQIEALRSMAGGNAPPIPQQGSPPAIEGNALSVRAAFDPGTYAGALAGYLEELAGADGLPEGSADGETVLREFLQPARFLLLRDQ